ncbi:hypothetical protein PFISCL1PPCAC_17488, partial [Pristionchus fissidentatus]
VPPQVVWTGRLAVFDVSWRAFGTGKRGDCTTECAGIPSTFDVEKLVFWNSSHLRFIIEVTICPNSIRA